MLHVNASGHVYFAKNVLEWYGRQLKDLREKGCVYMYNVYTSVTWYLYMYRLCMWLDLIIIEFCRDLI